MEFKEKQFDGPYEVAGVDFQIEDQLFKGVLYYPPESFKKPYPLITYFHGFPQVFTLQEIIKSYQFLLDSGYAFLTFNFRGYRFSQGNISISSQVLDGLAVVKFIKNLIKNNIFDRDNINILAHDFGAYIALILCSKTDLINKLLLLSPIIDLEKHINAENFEKQLYYINRFLPGHLKGISNVNRFIEMTKKELSDVQFQIKAVLKQLKNKELKLIIGEEDRVTPVSETDIIKGANLEVDLAIIECMDHMCGEDEEIEQVNKEIKSFFKI